MEIRKATTKDIKHIVNFVKKIAIKESKFDPKIGINYDVYEKNKTKKYYKEVIENEFGLTIVAEEDNGKVIGYLNSYVIEKNNIFKYDVAFINALYVLEKEDNNSKAYTMLLEEFEKWSKDCGVKYAKARIYQSDELNKFYKKNGYQIEVIDLEKKLGD